MKGKHAVVVAAATGGLATGGPIRRAAIGKDRIHERPTDFSSGAILPPGRRESRPSRCPASGLAAFAARSSGRADGFFSRLPGTCGRDIFAGRWRRAASCSISLVGRQTVRLGRCRSARLARPRRTGAPSGALLRVSPAFILAAIRDGTRGPAIGQWLPSLVGSNALNGLTLLIRSSASGRWPPWLAALQGRRADPARSGRRRSARHCGRRPGRRSSTGCILHDDSPLFRGGLVQPGDRAAGDPRCASAGRHVLRSGRGINLRASSHNFILPAEYAETPCRLVLLQ